MFSFRGKFFFSFNFLIVNFVSFFLIIDTKGRFHYQEVLNKSGNIFSYSSSFLFGLYYNFILDPELKSFVQQTI